jgi:ribosomal protein S18 acetylase RimI-like enzyme
VKVRALGASDLAACLALGRERGFAGGEPAWRLAVATGTPLGVDAPDGGLAGAAVLLAFGGRAASLALAVSPRFTRRGVGRALAEHALGAAGRIPVQMHAPAAALPFCERLGFRPVGGTVRLTGWPAPGAPAPPGPVSLRPVSGADLAGIVALDELAFGAPRRALLEAVLPASVRVALAVAGGRTVGYGVAWADSDAVAIGPIVCEDDGAAVVLAAHLAAGHDLPVRVDVPHERAAMQAWARAAGLTSRGTAALLSLGGRPLPGRRERLHALVTAAFV